jgi:hypothetical protein
VDQLVNSLCIVSAMSIVRRARGGSDVGSIAVMIGHIAAGINDTSGVKTKVVPGVPDDGRRSSPGIDLGGHGGPKPTRRLGRRKCSRNPRRSCGEHGGICTKRRV